jgi:FKBP-type peptidyl-prolyl cis-trans isomerase 2
MRTSQIGDRVRVHYAKRFADGSVRSSRGRGDAPLELIVGTDHPRLPGLGSTLVGVTEGQTVTVWIPAERAYGLPDPARIRRVDRARFAADEDLKVGRRVWMRLRRGGSRAVRILEVDGGAVVIDTNHPRSGQSVELEVELVAIFEGAPAVSHRGP